MVLVDHIIALKDRTISDLNAAHDYSSDTKLAWETIRRLVEAKG